MRRFLVYLACMRVLTGTRCAVSGHLTRFQRYNQSIVIFYTYLSLRNYVLLIMRK